MIVMKIDSLAGAGNSKIEGYDDGNWTIVDKFSVGIEREMKESKSGTTDIGLGELQECRITKTLDLASPVLAQFAIIGQPCGTVQLDFLETGADGESIVPYARYMLSDCYVKTWSTSGDADDRPTEEVAFYYNKIAFNTGLHIFNWKQGIKPTSWGDHGLPPVPPPDAS